MDQKTLRSFLLTGHLSAPAPASVEIPAPIRPQPPTSQIPSESLNSPHSQNSIEARTQAGLKTLLDRSFFGPQPPPFTAGYPASPSTAATTPLRPVPAPPLVDSKQTAALLPSFILLKSQILRDLELNVVRLLTLNVSRREAVAQYLDRLAGLPSGPSTINGNIDAAAGLRRWIEGPRSPAQDAALRTYFEEIALIILGQAVLLKAWSDRSIRRWSEADLKDLNWATNSALKPHVPLDRESWQMARQNIYSWYKPSPAIQKDMWTILDLWKIENEPPAFLSALLTDSRQARPLQNECLDPRGYDSRFFHAVWDHMPLYGFNPNESSGPIRRQKVAFSPTLRDGEMVRSAPHSLQWIGLESSPYQIMVAELLLLWWGFTPPPLWAIGNGLEVHTRDQLTLNLGSPKPSLLTRISEMEACELAFILEERSIRAQGRSAEAQRFREHAETLPYFKKLRSAGTTQGDLQACVAVTKLRPGGLLWWGREEPLSTQDGNEMLNFMLERSKLVCEWDFSGVQHNLPSSKPLFPKYLYLFSRETKVEERLTHRPMQIRIQGQLRTQPEVQLLLEDSFQAMQRGQNGMQTRGAWKITLQLSPTCQRDWAERWPDPTSQTVLREIEKLRESSLPLASATTIRPTPPGDPNKDHSWNVHFSLHGFWIQAHHTAEGRRLVTRPLPRAGKETQGSGYLVLVPDESWVAPLSHYLESESVRNYLEHHAERRGDRWILNEQVVKWIPVPKVLFRSLGFVSPADAQSGVMPGSRLPSEWEKIAALLAHQPQVASEAIQKLDSSAESHEIRIEMFVRVARTLDHFQAAQAPLLSLVTDEGKIRWSGLLNILPKADCVPVTTHPKVQVIGNLLPHQPIGHITPIKMPTPGILFATESGFNLRLLSDSTMVLDMIWDQLEGLASPTWSELVQYLKLPRLIEAAETTANEVLRSHGEQTRRLRQLSDLLSTCLVF